MQYFQDIYNFQSEIQMAKRQSWNSEEDNLITQLIFSYETSNKKIKWTEISQVLKKLNINWKRTGKQCRERWLNHLKPSMGKSIVIQDFDLKILFQLIRVHGKKWSTIAKELPGSATDNAIKNFFYASLRKGLRNLNVYNVDIRECRRYKVYKYELIDKILSVYDEKKRKDLYIVDSSVYDLTHRIRETIIQCSLTEINSSTQLTKELEFYYQSLNDMIAQFCRICKFKKSRGKNYDQDSEKFEVFTRKISKKNMMGEKKEDLFEDKSQASKQMNDKTQTWSQIQNSNENTFKNSQNLYFQLENQPYQNEELYKRYECMERDQRAQSAILMEQNIIKIDDSLFQYLSKNVPCKADLNYLLY